MLELFIPLLGPFAASYDDRPRTNFRSNRAQALLVYLLMTQADAPESIQSREAIIADLGREDAPA